MAIDDSTSNSFFPFLLLRLRAHNRQSDIIFWLVNLVSLDRIPLSANSVRSPRNWHPGRQLAIKIACYPQSHDEHIDLLLQSQIRYAGYF